MIPPYYYHFRQEEVIGYYEDVMSAVDIPIIIYNIPAFTGISFTKGNSKHLLSHPQIVGIKHTSMNLYDLERMKAAYPEKIYFNGYDEIFLSSLAAGTTAAVGTTVNLFPEWFKKIRALYLAGNMKKAAELQNRINTAIEVFVDVGIFNAIKYVFTLQGINCGSCRRPFKPLTDDQKRRIVALLEALNMP
jgi:N-acetylneuraminate lyase